MKAYRIELFVIDFDGQGADEIKSVIENARYPNRCIDPSVQAIEGCDIGQWHDDHPLNKRDSFDAEYARLFAVKPAAALVASARPSAAQATERAAIQSAAEAVRWSQEEAESMFEQCNMLHGVITKFHAALGHLDDPKHDVCIQRIRALAAPCLPERAPEGWKLVPVKIADEMKRAFWKKREERPLLDLNECYSASIAAAPDHPALSEIEIAREDQAARVMPLIGPMLDALEGLPNDTRGALEEDANALFNCLAAIQNAVEDDDATLSPQGAENNEGVK